MTHQGHSFPHNLSKSWYQRLADDLAAELEAHTGEKRSTIEEMRRFLAVKGCHQLFDRMQAAREGKERDEALRSVARIMRAYALERPALFAATLRTIATDSPEWREAVGQIRKFLISLFAECGLYGAAAEQAQRILKCIVRGFVLHELMDDFLDPVSYEESYEDAILVFLTGLPALVCRDQETARPRVFASIGSRR